MGSQQNRNSQKMTMIHSVSVQFLVPMSLHCSHWSNFPCLHIREFHNQLVNFSNGGVNVIASVAWHQ